MNVPSIHILALSILASVSSALATAPAQAQQRSFDFRSARASRRAQRINNQRMQRARDAARRPAADTAICSLDQDTGAGSTILMVPAIVSVTLVKGMPDRFGLVGEEICGDLRDNDCNGLVDENCGGEDGSDGICGDGVVQEGEECDDANDIEIDDCRNDCTIGDPGPPQCGDGIIQIGEECDDGNTIDGDACNNECRVAEPPRPRCGDGIVQIGEECDDGNTIDGDACNNECRIPEPDQPLCGDGIVQLGEECDDGNGVDNDRCSNECRLNDGPRPEYWQAGYECEDCMESACAGEAQACINDPDCAAPRECVIQEGCLSPYTASLSCLCGSLSIPECQVATSFPGACAEQLIDGMGTSDARELFGNWIEPTTPAGRANRAFVCMSRKCKSQCSQLFNLPPAPECGNGQREGQEECDDGNRRDGDGCSAYCKKEAPRCGDGDINQESEQCDDGNSIDDDRCTNDCKINPNPNRGSWLAGPGCDACMQDRCSVQNDACLGDADCETIRSCVGESLCLNPELGSLTCLCGTLSIAECQKSDNFPGACAVELVQGLSDDNPKVVFGEWLNPGRYTGRANAAYNCMTRRCIDECVVLFEGESPAEALCGDGKVNKSGEECDDGNTQSGDGCSAQCIIEKPDSEEGFWFAGPQCDACMDIRCANESERCRQNPAGCDPARSCMGETNCSDESFGPFSCMCGEGVNPNECAAGSELRGICAPFMAEPENLRNPNRAIVRINDPRNPASSASRAFVCMARSCPTECSNNFGGSAKRPCGNGTVEGGEQCDDGNALSGDGCSATCEVEACGNNRRDVGEECDDGNTQNGDGCTADCKLEPPVCGNGIVEGDEECDDTNTVDGDGCTADCRKEYSQDDFRFGPECGACMVDKCDSQLSACAENGECIGSSACIREARCLSTRIGPLSCVCGDLSVAQCTAAPMEELQGPCAADIIKGLGAKNPAELFKNFVRRETPTGLSNDMYVCMARRCDSACSEYFLAER